MKAKIDEFFTAVFDTEKKELITLEFREAKAGRVTGYLQRYSYPDFRSVGKYKLPHLGFRAALDAKNEQLYVAVTTTPTKPLEDARFDRAFAIGDVAVYDLKAVREGRAADGKPLADDAVLAPVGTFGFRSIKIHGMEVSGDGKNLFVLTTNTTSKKAALISFDTATRKEAKRNDLTDPVIDLVSAGDGKNLFVVEDLSPKTKGSRVLGFDMSAFGQPVKTIKLIDGAALNVAPFAGGVMVSVLPNSSASGRWVRVATAPAGRATAVPVGASPGDSS